MLNKNINWDIIRDYERAYNGSDKPKQKEFKELLKRTLSFDYARAGKLLSDRSPEYCAGYFVYLYSRADKLRAEPWQTVEAFFMLLQELSSYPAQNAKFPSRAAEILAHIYDQPQRYGSLKQLLQDARKPEYQGMLNEHELDNILIWILLSFREESYSFFQKFQ